MFSGTNGVFLLALPLEGAPGFAGKALSRGRRHSFEAVAAGRILVPYGRETLLSEKLGGELGGTCSDMMRFAGKTHRPTLA